MKVTVYVTRQLLTPFTRPDMSYADLDLVANSEPPLQRILKFAEYVKKGVEFKCITYDEEVIRTFLIHVRQGVITEPRLILLDLDNQEAKINMEDGTLRNFPYDYFDITNQLPVN